MSLEFIDKKSKKKIFINILLIISFLIFLGYIGFSLFNKIKDPNNYLNNVCDKLVFYVEDTFNFFTPFKEIDYNKESKLTGSIKFSSNDDNLSNLNNYNINYLGTASRNFNEIELNLDVLKNRNSVLTGNIYLQENNLFLESTDLFKDIIEIEEFNNLLSTLNNNDLIKKDIFIKFIKYFFESLSLTDKKGEIVDFYKVKYVYEINNNNVSNINNHFFNLLKNDNNFKLLVDELNKNKIEFIPLRIEVVNNYFTGEVLDIRILSNDSNIDLEKDNKNYRYVLKQNNDKIYLNLKNSKISLNKYKNDVFEKTIEFSKKNDSILINLINSNFSINFTLKEKNLNNYLISLKYSDQNKKEKIDLDGDIKIFKNKLEFNLLTDVIGNKYNLGMLSNGNILYDDNLFEKKEIKNSISIDKLTEFDKEKIVENFNKKFDI